MDIMIYKVLYELPNDINTLRKKTNYTYQHMRKILLDLEEQGIISHKKSAKGVVIEFHLTDTGIKIQELLTNVYKIIGK